MNAERPGEIKNKTEPGLAAGWYCVRCQRKREAVAAAHLRGFGDVEVFNPFLRFRRATARGPAWVTEPLFPNYLFARFQLKTGLAKVRSARGVAGMVHFGDHHPRVPDETIEEMRRLFGGRELLVSPGEPVAGASVELAGGVFHGLEAVICRVLPARERVNVLLDFMGRQTMVEVDWRAVVPVWSRSCVVA
jgi:transcriptional antiterminator RfaH